MPTSVYGLTRQFYDYISDDGFTYTLSMSADSGVAQGASPTTAPGASPPRGYKVRHIYGVAADGTRTKIPILDKSNPLWATTNTFDKHLVTFAVEGRKGENRIFRD